MLWNLRFLKNYFAYSSFSLNFFWTCLWNGNGKGATFNVKFGESVPDLTNHKEFTVWEIIGKIMSMFYYVKNNLSKYSLMYNLCCCFDLKIDYLYKLPLNYVFSNPCICRYFSVLNSLILNCFFPFWKWWFFADSCQEGGE